MRVFLIFVLSFCSLSSRTFAACSASLDSSKTDQSGEIVWNPRNDAILDDKSGLCYFEIKPTLKFDSKLLPLVCKSLKGESPSIEPSCLNAKYSSNRGWLSSCIDYSQEYLQDSDENLHVPEKCLSYIRKWDFYIGNPEDESKIIGWISLIGFAHNMIKDLKLSTTKNFSYTLLPSHFYFKSDVNRLLLDSKYLEINCKQVLLFWTLFSISKVVDQESHHLILAITFSFDDLQNASIKILVSPLITYQQKENIYYRLLDLNPFVDYYKSYF